MSLLELSASELVAATRAGLLTPVEVVEAYIGRIVAVNPAINALAHERFAAARREAAALAATPPAARGPLFGVPVTIKDAFDVAGTRCCCGLSSRADHVPQRDAAAVARLREAGAIVLATTITPDNCWAQETVSPLFGRTRNPWDLRRSVGGSTGGEAALIASLGSPLGLGSDIAGSIRLPAAFCGVVGLRPTSGAIPEAGFWPPSAGALAHLNAVGPLARRVEDVALAFAVLRGAEPRPPNPELIAGARLAYWSDVGLLPSSRAVGAGVRAAARALESAGMRPVAGAPAARRLALLGWTACFGAAERRSVAEGFGGGVPWSPCAELARMLAGQGRVSPEALYYWLGSHLGSLLNELALQLDGARWGEELRGQLLELVGEDGLVVCPVFPTTAPPHGYSYLAMLATLSYQVWVNLAGLPALALPVGFSGRGMPVAVQLVGAPGGEARLLAAGMVLQQALMPRWMGPAPQHGRQVLSADS